MGTLFDTDVLRQASSPMPEEDFLRGVEELVAHKILLETSRKLDLEFAHDLLRELVYQELSAARCRFLHQRVGEVLENLRNRGGHCPLEWLAYHFSRAGVNDKAFQYLLEAGAAALRAYAVDNSVRHLNEALELASEAIRPEQRYRLNDLLGSAYSAAWAPEKAIPSGFR